MRAAASSIASGIPSSSRTMIPIGAEVHWGTSATLEVHDDYLADTRAFLEAHPEALTAVGAAMSMPVRRWMSLGGGTIPRLSALPQRTDRSAPHACCFAMARA